MRSSFGQKLANYYPVWTKIRKDPSSFGHRLYKTIAPIFEIVIADFVKISESADILRESLGLGEIYRVNLDPEDFFTSSLDNSGYLSWSELVSADALIGVTTIPLTKVDTLEDLAFSPTTRLSLVSSTAVADKLIYNSDTDVYATIDYGSRLKVIVSGSQNFPFRSPGRNPNVSGIRQVTIVGRDINYSLVSETIRILDDGVYHTKNPFFGELIEVNSSGFDGLVEVYLLEPTDYITDRYRVCTTEESTGPLRLSLFTNPVEGFGTALRYWTDRVKFGQNYKDGSPEIPDNTDVAWEQHLLTTLETSTSIVDICVHPDNTRLYAIGSNGILYIYEHGLGEFLVPTYEPSRDPHIILQATTPWTVLGQDVRFFTRFSSYREPIKKVIIKRVSPSQVVEYLQGDKTTWDPTLYEFITANWRDLRAPEDTWIDFSFKSDLDEFGQWEFYLEAFGMETTTLAYTAVMLDGLIPVAELDTEIANPLSLGFNFNNNLIIATATHIHELQEHSDLYLEDSQNQRILLREVYDSFNGYVAERQNLWTTLDELGLTLSMRRLAYESIGDFRRRLLLEARQRSGSTEWQFINSVNRQVGEFESPVFKIDLILDVNGEPLAPDPALIITSSRLYLYRDYANEVLDFEINLTHRDNFYLSDIYILINASTYFSIDIIDINYANKQSKNLRFGNSFGFIPSEELSVSQQNITSHQYVKNFYPPPNETFLSEKATLPEVVADGDYFINKTTGFIATYSTARGNYAFSYADFPFTVFWQPLKVWPYNHIDKQYFLKNSIIGNQDGSPEYNVPNSEDIKIIDSLLVVHPLTWGE